MSDPGQLFTAAIALQNAGRFAEAVATYDEFLLGYVGNAQMHTNRGLALFELGRMDEAIAAYRQAVLCEAGYFAAHYGMGMALFVQRRYLEALVSFDAAMAIAPSVDVYLSRGATRMELGQYESALDDCDAALRSQPNFAKAYLNKGLALYEMERLSQAQACYAQALWLHPNDHSTEWNEALCLLRAGNLQGGWPRYERRLEGSLSQTLLRAEYGKPRFLEVATEHQLAGRLAGKTILLWPEQGHGDVLHFCRYAHELKRFGATVILEAYPPLLRLLEIAFANTGIRVALDGTVSPSEFDFHLPLVSSPLVCGTNSWDKVPNRTPYLFALSQEVQAWQERMTYQGLAVGLVWAGGHRPNQPIDVKVDAARSLRLAAFAPLLALSNTMDVQFFSLQLGEPAQQLQQQQGLPIIDLTAGLSDWADTAAFIANLDLVISCDTAVAHLAAAMGKPTWILSRFNGCWRWLQDRDDSPWYPTVRLFRQQTRGDWGTVIAEVVAALRSQMREREMAHE